MTLCHLPHALRFSVSPAVSAVLDVETDRDRTAQVTSLEGFAYVGACLWECGGELESVFRFV